MKKIILGLIIFTTLAGCFSDSSSDGSDGSNPPVLSSDATLAGLILNDGNIDPGFSSEITSYSIVVEHDTDVLKVEAESANAAAVVSINPQSPVSLAEGLNTITITVTAQDGSQKIYTLKVTRKAAPNSNAKLSSLVIDEGSLEPNFDPDVTAYSVVVENDIDSIDIDPTPEDANAQVAMTPSSPVSLSVGDNTIEIKVTAQSGTERTYTLAVTRKAPPSNDATLASLSTNAGTLIPVFSPYVTDYYLTVGYATASLTVTAAAADANAQLSMPSSPISLQIGDNVIEIKVTAEDGTEKIYKLNVTREYNLTAPSNLTISQNTPCSVNVSWNDNTGNEENYILAYSDDSFTTTIETLTLPADTESVDLTGLTRDTTYYFRLFAENQEGSSSTVSDSFYVPGVQNPVTVPAGSTEIKITYNEGRVWQGTQIYNIWLKSNTDNRIIPVLITGRTLANYGAIGTALAYWRRNIQSMLSSTQIDAVTTATPNLPANNAGNLVGKQIATPIPANAATRGRGSFSVNAVIPADLRQFTVYFELEHSWDSNNYFGDQPAVIYSADVDLDNFPSGSSGVLFEYLGWTMYNNTTVGGISRLAGVLQQGNVNRLLLYDCDTGEYPATDMMMNGATVTIE